MVKAVLYHGSNKNYTFQVNKSTIFVRKHNLTCETIDKLEQILIESVKNATNLSKISLQKEFEQTCSQGINQKPQKHTFKLITTYQWL